MLNLQKVLLKMVIKDVKNHYIVLSTQINKFSTQKSEKLIDQFSRVIFQNSSSQKLIKVDYEISKNNYKEKIKIIDSQLRVEKFEKSEMLDSLGILVQKIPGQITQLNFYYKAIEQLVEHFSKTQITTSEFTKLIFLIGLLKKHPKSREYIITLMKAHPHIIDQLSSFEFVILSNSLFKIGLPLKDRNFHVRIIEEIRSSDMEIPLLITLIKSYRQNKLQSEEIITRIKELKRAGKFVNIDFQSLAHLFTLLAEARNKDQELISFFMENGYNHLKTGGFKIRIKDWAKFLFCCAYLNLQINERFLGCLEALIEQKLEKRQYNNFDHIVDSVLSLRILGSKRLVAQTVAHQDFVLTNKPQRVKLEARQKLLSFLNICDNRMNERKPALQLISHSPAPNYLVRRSMLNIQQLLSENGFEPTTFVRQFDEIRIAGILLRHQDKISYIEILDDTNRLTDFQPIGIFKLKMELLRNFGQVVIMIDACKSNADILEIIKKTLESS